MGLHDAFLQSLGEEYGDYEVARHLYQFIGFEDIACKVRVPSRLV